MNEQELSVLIEKYLSGQCTDEEKAWVEKWYEEREQSGVEFYGGDTNERDKSEQRSYEAIEQKIAALEYARQATVIPMRPKRLRLYSRIAVAAGVLIALSIVWIREAKRGQPDKQVAIVNQSNANDIPPGVNKAILTLADNSTVVLNDVKEGTIAAQGNTSVVKQDSAVLTYQASGNNSEVLYNTITTPKGGQYQVILPDGSHVWLNAASSLRFPTAFAGNERTVTLTGEGYFEVTKNAAKPFKVKVNDMTVQVLGTHFNVMAYGDERSLNTTLLEGSVSIQSSSGTTLLKPGEQAQMNKSGAFKIVKDEASIDDAVAWKDQLFQFSDADIHTIMRQVSRWYDVEVEFRGDIRQSFVATISRNMPVSGLLHLLELTNKVHFIIEGKKIIVRP